MKSIDRDTVQEILSSYPLLMRPEEVAEALRCTDRTVRNLIAENQLECTRVGRNICVSKSSVLDYLCRPVSVAQYRPMKSISKACVQQIAAAPEKTEPDDDVWVALKAAAERIGYQSVLVRTYNIVKRGMRVGIGKPIIPFEQIPREKWGELRNCGKKTLELLYEAFPEKC